MVPSSKAMWRSVHSHQRICKLVFGWLCWHGYLVPEFGADELVASVSADRVFVWAVQAAHQPVQRHPHWQGVSRHELKSKGRS